MIPEDQPLSTDDDASTEAIHDESHEQNDNWEWSTEVTEYVASHISGRSLKICPGLKPIADYNLDVKPLATIATSENADFTVKPTTTPQSDTSHTEVIDGKPTEIIHGKIQPDNTDTNTRQQLYDGWACQGDMYSLPFKPNSFDTTIADPPWLELSLEQRKQILTQAIKVTRPTGKIILNSTWSPESETNAREYKLRFRQQGDFWGGCSFITFYKRTANDIKELFEAHDYTSEERYPDESGWWSEAYHPNALSTEHNTDPKLVSNRYDQYCCPMCGNSQLGQIQDGYFETDSGEYSLYECLNCNFRVEKEEVERLAKAIEDAAPNESSTLGDIESIDYTPPSVEQVLDNPSVSVVTDNMPWIPEPNSR